MKRRIVFSMTVFLILALSITATSAQDFSPFTQIRIVHASPDAPPVDVWINNILIPLGAPFETISAYSTGPANVYNFKITPAGGTIDTAVIDEDLNLFFNQAYTLVAIDLLEDIDGLLMVDDNTNNPAAARVRFLHASPDAPAVDIKVAGGPFLFQDIEFEEVGNYVEVPTVTADIEVRVAGTDTVVLTVPSVSLMAGTTYTVFAVGEVGEGTLKVLLSVDA